MTGMCTIRTIRHIMCLISTRGQIPPPPVSARPVAAGSVREMSTRTCPVCGSPVVPLGAPGHESREGAETVYACTTEGCEGRLQDVGDDDAARANEPTGGDNIGA